MGCIYSITVGSDPRQYIGSAADLKNRMKYHLWNFRRGSHHCLKLRRAVRKHGIAALRVAVLETVADVDLIPAEQRWLDKCWGSLFNTCPTAQSRRGAKMPIAGRRAISRSLIGNTRRRGIKCTPAERARIGAGVKRAYAEGRKKPSLNPQNLAAFTAAARAGIVLWPKQNPQRDAAIVAMHETRCPLGKIAVAFGVTTQAIRCVLIRCNPAQYDALKLRKRKRKCQST